METKSRKMKFSDLKDMLNQQEKYMEIDQHIYLKQKKKENLEQ